MASDQSQQLLNNVQLYQQQLQGVGVQREALNAQLLEITSALDELEKTKEKDVYKVSGPLLLKSPVGEVKNDLKEKQELVSMRMKVLEKSEQKLKVKIDELRERLMKAGTGS